MVVTGWSVKGKLDEPRISQCVIGFDHGLECFFIGPTALVCVWMETFHQHFVFRFYFFRLGILGQTQSSKCIKFIAAQCTTVLGVGFDFFFEQNVQGVFDIFCLPALCADKGRSALTELPGWAVASLRITAERGLSAISHALKIVIALVIFLCVSGAIIPELAFSVAALWGAVLCWLIATGPFAWFDCGLSFCFGGWFRFDADFVENF